MDRSRRLARREARRDGSRDGASDARTATPPASSRLTLRRTRNRRRPGTIWSRLPRPAAIADACGRAARRALPAAAAVAVVAVLGGGLWAGYRWLARSPRFAITRIAITGAHRVDPDALRARLPIQIGDNAFTGLAEVARVVRAEPWVAAAEVRRQLPHTVAIELRERVAAALVELGELYLVDASGRPFKRAALEAGEGDGLPVLTGLGRAAFAADPTAAAATVRDALDALERWRGGTQRPANAEVHLDPHGAVTLHTRSPAIAIQLGATGGEAGARIRAFDTAWAGLSPDERARTRAIHLDTRPDHVTVAFAKD
ncbi:MAG TPA: FtsQ-type POTRA domain-containing protein [Kofleriaceae bacterium]|nr:FtsQ-type POTRA domain-containing protein [Kofleriaceae bacterium]